MKRKIILTLLSFVFVTAIYAQKSIESVFSKYKNVEDFTYVSIGSGAVNMVKSFVDISKLSSNEKAMIEKLSGLKILSLNLNSDHEINLSKSIIAEVERIVKTDKYEVVAEVRDKNTHVNIYSSKNKNEMVIVNKDTESSSVIWIK